MAGLKEFTEGFQGFKESFLLQNNGLQLIDHQPHLPLGLFHHLFNLCDKGFRSFGLRLEDQFQCVKVKADSKEALGYGIMQFPSNAVSLFNHRQFFIFLFQPQAFIFDVKYSKAKQIIIEMIPTPILVWKTISREGKNDQGNKVTGKATRKKVVVDTKIGMDHP